jgi:uncharacterized protein YihD (DUF1040 family)
MVRSIVVMAVFFYGNIFSYEILLTCYFLILTYYMAQHSNKSKAEVSTTTLSLVAKVTSLSSSSDNDNVLLERKISLATEGFTTDKFCEHVLRDRSKLSKENALTICEYIIAMKREINPRLSHKRNTIQFLSELSKAIGIAKKFIDMTREDVLCYLDKCRNSENEDPLHKWIGSYNTKRMTISRFFKWLYYPDIEDPKRRNELSKSERKPDCMMGISKLKRKEVSCYKPSDLSSLHESKSHRLYCKEGKCPNEAHGGQLFHFTHSKSPKTAKLPIVFRHTTKSPKQAIIHPQVAAADIYCQGSL